MNPPYAAWYSVKLVTSTGTSIGPFWVLPTNAVVDVLTPSIGRAPLGTSWMYTPGCNRSIDHSPWVRSCESVTRPVVVFTARLRHRDTLCTRQHGVCQ